MEITLLIYLQICSAGTSNIVNSDISFATGITLLIYFLNPEFRGQAGTSNCVNKMYYIFKQLIRIISYLQIEYHC